ncbi:glycosyltransferase family 4 protein [Fundicoccus sp. Sow4_F4]|uniref:glycosyltransferase family 4 protein n=1 Tax=Fundicoccus sp. Sow4_F4 TaxID=3438783 RepID=UPI003F930488
MEDYFDPNAGYQINELLIANKKNRSNDDVILITSNDMSPFHKNVDNTKDIYFENETGAKIIRLEVKFKYSSRIIMKNLFNTINKLNPDIVYLHGIGDFKDLRLLKKKPKYTVVRDCHMSWVASKNRFRKLYYKLFKLVFANIINNTDKYKKIFALGNEEYQYLKLIGIEDHKISYLRHGYNDTVIFFDPDGRKEIRNKYDFKHKDIVISYIGKFNDSKEPDLIFDIVERFLHLQEDYRLIKLLFIGPKEDKYMNKFNMKLDKMKDKLEIIVDDSKKYSDLKRYYSASDICIFPKETTLSSIHAQICGCPVIMENHISNQERVVNNNNLFVPGDFSQAAQILKKIIDEKEYIKNNQYLRALSDREYGKQIVKIRDLANGNER